MLSAKNSSRRCRNRLNYLIAANSNSRGISGPCSTAGPPQFQSVVDRAALPPLLNVRDNLQVRAINCRPSTLLTTGVDAYGTSMTLATIPSSRCNAARGASLKVKFPQSRLGPMNVDSRDEIRHLACTEYFVHVQSVLRMDWQCTLSRFGATLETRDTDEAGEDAFWRPLREPAFPLQCIASSYSSQECVMATFDEEVDGFVLVPHGNRIGDKILTKGRAVTPSAYGMDTAWVAVYDIGRRGPVVSFNAEMDYLPGIGHACGHNLIATASVLGAVAAAQVIKQCRAAGKIVLFGTPAEEGGGGEIKLLNSDHKVNVSLISHPAITSDAALMRTTSYLQFKVEYFGREAHAEANPWLGINALDALIAGYNNVSALRQQMIPEDRAGYAKRLDELKKKVYDCCSRHRGQGGPLPSVGVTRTTCLTEQWRDPIHVTSTPSSPEHHRRGSGRRRSMGGGKTQANTDQGDISHAMPSLNAAFRIQPGPKGQGPHNPGVAEAAGTRDYYARTLRVAKG
nr:peptidase m20 domain protein [Trichoderma rodmanii]